MAMRELKLSTKGVLPSEDIGTLDLEAICLLLLRLE